jgi:hypothetical protein
LTSTSEHGKLVQQQPQQQRQQQQHYQHYQANIITQSQENDQKPTFQHYLCITMHK